MRLLDDRALLERLVSIDSTSGRSAVPIADELCAYLDRPGVRIHRLSGPADDRENLLVMAGPEGVAGGAGLTLCGHLDTVPADPDQWTSDPLTLSERDGAWYGRGTCDMKGFIAIAANVFATASAGRTLRTPLCLLLTCDEELGSLGAQHLVACADTLPPLPAATVVGEPTSLRVVRMHKGHLRVRVTLHGRAAHSGLPHLGSNAIEPAGPVLTALSGLAAALKTEPLASGAFFPAVPFTVLNLGRIAGGEAVNVVPDRCVIDLGVRLLPGQGAAAMADRIGATVERAAGGYPHEVRVMNDSPPYELPEDAPVHKALCRLVGQSTSHAVSFASDAGHLTRLGLRCVLFGPGNMDTAHRPDECVPIAEMARCRKVLEQLVG